MLNANLPTMSISIWWRVERVKNLLFFLGFQYDKACRSDKPLVARFPMR